MCVGNFGFLLKWGKVASDVKPIGGWAVGYNRLPEGSGLSAICSK